MLEAIRSATEADVRALRQVAKEAKEGAVNDNQARAKAAAINPAFVSITASTEVQIALWALLFAILSFYLQLCASWSDDQSSATAHQDARNQLQATKSLERVQEKIHAELRRQADAATAKAQAQQVLPASLTQTPEPIVNRHERRKAARLAKMKR